ncbi:hypothetical protein QWY31_09240 [Cytophagales bacterium LB-30]|uniref:RDD family protein n=1 Tax=Shiella aurantiaca TaxID=3058365 RepID=A0ABT8F627_9BACT|nr:hypothetical protein [Shiella aurantiaca]MDN4165686.1 hypothetical protein [Shiella aurantiaca]
MQSSSELRTRRIKAGVVDTLLALALCLIPVLGVAYFLCKDALWWGPSVGKKWQGLVVQTTQGESIKSQYGISIRRNLLLALPLLDLLECYLIYTGRGLGDRWAGTKVVEREEVIK